MNYLIQNFSFNTQKFFVTPKLKLFFFLIMFKKLIFFKKIYHFSIYSFKNFIFVNSYFQFFYRYFFSNQIMKIIKKKPTRYYSFYENNILKSITYWIYNLFLLLKNFDSNKFFLFSNKNKYLITYKLLNYKLTRSFYKNLFFLFILLNADLWFFCNNKIKFYLNFFFISNKFTLYPFFGGYFFNIYNF